MGHSRSVHDLQKQEDNFRAYLNKLQAELESRSDKYLEAMEKNINDFYKLNGFSSERFIYGKNADFMQKSEWSLKNVKHIIDSIAKAIFRR